ncbi:MAG: type 4a pilus biogenesis protein PilO [Planctomycetota bacterium]|nr:type 4a pilus biogenesis protein PilO [Planctomycetota bacterium]
MPRPATGKVPNDTWIMFAVLSAIVGAFVLVIYLPQSRYMNQLQAQMAQDKDEIERDAGAVVDRRLPKEVDVGAFYKDVSAGFAQEKLARPYMAIQSPVREDLYTTLPIQLQTEGNYLSVGRLLQRLDGMERLTQVEKLELKAQPKGSHVEVSMLVNIYHMPSEPEAAKDEQRKQ